MLTRLTIVTSIIILLGVGVYETSTSGSLGHRSRVDIGEQRIEKSNQTNQHSTLQSFGSKGSSNRTSGATAQSRVTKHTNSRVNLRPSNRDNLRNGDSKVFVVTAYTANDAGMNGKAITASGKRAKEHRTIAASRGYAYGTQIFFPELGRIYTVEDRGGRIKGNHIDLYYGTDLKGAKRFGKRKLKGVIIRGR